MIQEIEDFRNAIDSKYGVCSLCGKGAMSTILMTFHNKNDQAAIFCVEHSPWYPVSEAQRHWQSRMAQHAPDKRIKLQLSGDTEPPNPLPSWVKTE